MLQQSEILSFFYNFSVTNFQAKTFALSQKKFQKFFTSLQSMPTNHYSTKC